MLRLEIQGSFLSVCAVFLFFCFKSLYLFSPAARLSLVDPGFAPIIKDVIIYYPPGPGKNSSPNVVPMLMMVPSSTTTTSRSSLHV